MGQDKKLSREQIRKITDHLMIEKTALYPADLAFVFGSAPFCDELANAVANHFHKGYFNRIVVSGAPPTKRYSTEARHLFNELARQGVPSHRIIVEENATNTQ